MKNSDASDRRSFLRTAGAALVAASVPMAIAAQRDEPRPPSTNNLKQMIVFGGVSEPNPILGGIYGEACFLFQMEAEFGVGGYAVIHDPCLPDVNARVKILEGGRSDINDIYIFQGAVSRSANPDLIGKAVSIKVQIIDGDGNCNVSLTIENSPVAGLLLPAIQKVRVPIYPR